MYVQVCKYTYKYVYECGCMYINIYIRSLVRIQSPALTKPLTLSDLNVPLSGGNITDDTRIRESILTIQYLISKGLTITP
jgi:hypothetical protein